MSQSTRRGRLTILPEDGSALPSTVDGTSRAMLLLPFNRERPVRLTTPQTTMEAPYRAWCGGRVPQRSPSGSSGPFLLHKQDRISAQRGVMNLLSWEETVSQIALEASQEPNEAGQFKVLTAWRTKLKAAPIALRSFQIDEIVREVRRRFATMPSGPPRC